MLSVQNLPGVVKKILFTTRLVKGRCVKSAIMDNYPNYLREKVLDWHKDKPPQETADALNLLEAILDGSMSTCEIIDAVKNGTLPERYRPLDGRHE